MNDNVEKNDDDIDTSTHSYDLGEHETYIPLPPNCSILSLPHCTSSCNNSDTLNPTSLTSTHSSSHFQLPTDRDYRFYIANAMLLLFLDVMAVCISIAILPDTLVEFFNHGISCAGSLSKDDPSCKKANSAAAFASGVTTGVSALLTFAGSPIMGRISDSYGRKPLMIVSQILSLLPPFCLYLYSAYNISLYYYFITKSFSSVLDTTNLTLSYVADVCPPHHRSTAFGMLLAGLSFSVIVGPLIGSTVTVTNNYYICTVVALFALLYSFIIPESLRPQLRIPWSKQGINPFHSLRIISRYTLFRYLAAVVLLDWLSCEGQFTLIIPFMKLQFGIDSTWIMIVSIYWGAVGMFSQTIMLGIMVRYWSNKQIMLWGLACMIMSMIVYCLSFAQWTSFISIGFACMSLTTFPAISSIKSNAVGADEQGLIQGSLYGVRSLGGGIGPLLFTGLFSLFTWDDFPVYYPAAPYVLGAIIAIFTFVIGWRISDSVDPEEKQKFLTQQAEEKQQQQQISEHSINTNKLQTPLLSNSNSFIKPTILSDSINANQ